MCDADINPGIMEDWSLSRRSFMKTGALATAFVTSAAAAAENVVEKDVSITTPDGTCDAALIYPSGSGTWPAVIMWPDIMGLRPVFRDMGKRLAAQGYVVLVPNPFYRSKKAPVLEGTVDFSNREAMAPLFAYRNAITDDGVDKDAVALIAFLDKQPQTAKAKKVGVQGYCMSGPFAFRASAAVPNRVGGVASFHGGGLTTTTPNSPHLLIPKSKASFLVAIAKNDDAQQPTSKTILADAFKAAGRPAVVEVFEGNHGWTVPGSAAYNEPAAEKAWAELTKLYKANLV